MPTSVNLRVPPPGGEGWGAEWDVLPTRERLRLWKEYKQQQRMAEREVDYRRNIRPDDEIRASEPRDESRRKVSKGPKKERAKKGSKVPWFRRPPKDKETAYRKMRRQTFLERHNLRLERKRIDKNLMQIEKDMTRAGWRGPKKKKMDTT